MKTNYLFLLLCSICSSFPLLSQDLTADWNFLHQAREDYQDWLEESDLTKVIRVHDLIIKPEIVIMDLRISNGTDWISLKERYLEYYGTDLRRKLFKQMTFIFELKDKEAGLRIRSDFSDHYVDMRYRDTLVIHETVPRGMRKDSLQLKMKDIPGAVAGNGAATIQLSKSKLKQYFEKYFQKKRSFFQEAEIEVTDETDNHLNFQIWNITDEILDDLLMGYFEYIVVDMTLNVKGNVVKIYYDVEGKYGSGIYKGPRKSAFKRIDKSFYKQYMDDYKRRLTSRIRESLKQ